MKNLLYEFFIILKNIKEYIGNLEGKLVKIICYSKRKKIDCNKVIRFLVICEKILSGILNV